MQLLEHESKSLLAARGVAVPRGGLADSAEEAAEVASSAGARVAVKAQVPTGGRGKLGGILLVDADEAGAAASKLLGGTVKGFPVETVLVEEALDVSREIYLGVAVDPTLRSPVFLLGAAGGVDVEEHADAVARVPFSLARLLRPAQIWLAAEQAKLSPELTLRLIDVALAVAEVFRDQCARIVEVNPLVECGDGALVAADVRIIPAAIAVGDDLARGSRELGFDLITLDPEGDVGLITTGAGASMMLIDLLSRAGARPIDFCDLRTGSLRGDPSRILFVLDVLAAAPELKAVAVNVFAGVTDLEEFADVLLEAWCQRPLEVPLVVRVEGRGVERARERLTEAGIEVADSPEDLVARVSTHLGLAPSAAAGATL